jgi:hypothetical protein
MGWLFLAWIEATIAAACLLSGIAPRKRLERKRLAQWQADRFDHLIPVARFEIIPAHKPTGTRGVNR